MYASHAGRALGCGAKERRGCGGPSPTTRPNGHVNPASVRASHPEVTYPFRAEPGYRDHGGTDQRVRWREGCFDRPTLKKGRPAGFQSQGINFAPSSDASSPCARRPRRSGQGARLRTLVVASSRTGEPGAGRSSMQDWLELHGAPRSRPDVRHQTGGVAGSTTSEPGAGRNLRSDRVGHLDAPRSPPDVRPVGPPPAACDPRPVRPGSTKPGQGKKEQACASCSSSAPSI